MKKVKTSVGALLRGAVLLSPGLIAAMFFWHHAPALISILAAVAVELICLVVWAFAVALITTYRADKADKDPLPGIE